MGFWDTVGNLAKKGLEASQKAVIERDEYYEKYYHLDRESLIEKWKEASSLGEKSAVTKIMKENGWSMRDE